MYDNSIGRKRVWEFTKCAFYVHIFCVIDLLPQHGFYYHPKRRRDSAACTNNSHSTTDQVWMYFTLNDAYISHKLGNFNLWHTKFCVCFVEICRKRRVISFWYHSYQNYSVSKLQGSTYQIDYWLYLFLATDSLPHYIALPRFDY